MNWEIAYLFVWLRRSYVLIVSGLALFFAYKLLARPPELKPTVAVITCDGQVVYSNDPFSGLREPLVRDHMAELMTVLWNYERGQISAYAARFTKFRPKLEPYSPAARSISRIVTDNIGPDQNGPVAQESSRFEPDWKTFRVITEDHLWKVYLEGERIISRPHSTGTETFRYIINAGLGEGDYEAIFKLVDFNFSAQRS